MNNELLEMFHVKQSELDSALNEIEERQNIVLSSYQREQLLNHLALVLETNLTTNLTSVRSFEEGLTLHIEDSLTLHRAIAEIEFNSYCDLGTGGGFPGIPFGIMTGAKGVLIDSTNKKITAVNRFINELGLQNRLEAKAVRVEEYPKESSILFDLVVTRALSSLSSLLELSSPLLKKGGFLIAMKGAPSREEIDAANKILYLVGMSQYKVYELEIGKEGFQRKLIIYQKTHKARIKLPRRVGLAQKKPLTV